jgi:hypothetical protein
MRSHRFRSCGGHPLYYYSGDAPGKIMCQAANMHGGFWYVVNADGSANKAKDARHDDDGPREDEGAQEDLAPWSAATAISTLVQRGG